MIFLPGHKNNGCYVSSFFDSLPISCILCLVCHKRCNFLSFKGFFYPVFRYGLYCFSIDKLVIFRLIVLN